MVLTGVLVLAFGLVPQPTLMRLPLPWAFAGSLLFGAGAAGQRWLFVAMSTRLADCDLGMLAALADFRTGVSIWPGGNHTLLLASLPAMTASALLGYLSMLAGIALALGTLRAVRMPMPLLACSPAACEDPGSTSRPP